MCVFVCVCMCIHIFVGPVEPQPASKFVWLCWRRRCRCWRQRLCRRCHCVTFCAHTVAALPPCQAQTYWICRHFLLCTSVSDWEKACGFAVCQCVCSPGSSASNTHAHKHWCMHWCSTCAQSWQKANKNLKKPLTPSGQSYQQHCSSGRTTEQQQQQRHWS